MPPRTRLQSASVTLQPVGPAKPSTKATASPRKPKSPAKSPTKEHKTIIKQALVVPQPAPSRWIEVYELIQRQRQTFVAPVDVMGCDRLDEVDIGPSRRANPMDKELDKDLNQRSEKERRLSCLVSLMLSSQTKDEITAQATLNLKLELKGSLTVDSLRNSSLAEIESCINKVGFWRKKAQFLKYMADDLFLKHDSDVPKTLEELVALKGVGPKMAFLALSSAWSINIGIGVDTHVHRITNRLGWVKTTDPEATRVHLESWLPHHLFQEINRLLVGFGQVICLPVGPKCDQCFVGKVAGLCPSSNLNSKLVKKRKTDTKSTTRTSLEKNQKHKVRRKKETLTDKIFSKLEEDGKDLQSSKFFQSPLHGKLDSIKDEQNEYEEEDMNNASTSQVKIEIEDLNHKNINVKEEDEDDGIKPFDEILSSPLTEIPDDDSNSQFVNQKPHLCSSQFFSW